MVGLTEEVVGDSPLIALIGTLGLEAIRHGVDDDLLLQDLAPESLDRTNSCAIERTQCRLLSQPALWAGARYDGAARRWNDAVRRARPRRVNDSTGCGDAR
jgi:hypothetical protein